MPEPITTETASAVLPSFNLNGISLHLPPTPTGLLPDSRAITSGSSKRPFRKLNRPSTAPAKEDVVLLPSLQVGEELQFTPTLFSPEFQALLSNPPAHMQTVNEDDIDPVVEGSTLGTLPSPFEVYPLDIPPTVSEPAAHQSDWDWATFITAYATGRWDPHRTPNPPRSYFLNTSHIPYYTISDHPSVPPFGLSTSTIDVSQDGQVSASPTDAPQPPLAASKGEIPPSPSAESPLFISPTSLPLSASSPSLPIKKFRSGAPSSLTLPSHRFRSSFSAPAPSVSSDIIGSTSPHSNVEVQTTVATMRWAAARVDISPLALPSPEHELTDPMRGVMATIPGSHSQENGSSHYDRPISPSTSRKKRLTSFWEGTQDIDNGGSTHSIGPTRLTTISGSPSDEVLLNTPPDQDTLLDTAKASVDPKTLPLLPIAPLPASAPVLHTREDEIAPADYFGVVQAEVEDSVNSPGGISREGTASVPLRSESPPVDLGIMSVPALPRRICLTRQTSSPLPASTPHEARHPGGRVVSESITSVKAGRAAKEEQMFAELGYLAPPNPPDELDRRRALYKFNIWNTGPDLNFDRIAHLAKLVFNTKGVIISLIDSNEQWFKSEWGVKSASRARIHSFCAHAILQRGDEPLVILDSQKDWRFAKNPQVIGPPNVRFYAGAPLRTQDGFNIGTLSVIDQSPREDFTPRQRHTLKEFAAIAMREMELWRDKIQLRIRDRIQNSMEQFSRECLEIDTEAQAQNKERHPDPIVGASMDKVYDRAAKLVKRTLDVEGVIVMDISHCEVLESMSTEGTVSVVMHHGDPQIDTATRQLSGDEYMKLNAFFAKHPDGKISEGIIPSSFRPFLPAHIQYALTVPIFNIDKRPFALLCAYNVSDHTKRFLEGHELSYLRAIGVIILSAVLKRRMILADKAKGLFISNISHELRTPLHGILAAAELLSESPLNHSQISFLQTVQACGTSLVETVNHVLDFTKLSGNSKSGGVENVILSSKVDLMQLVEEAVDGCWVGHRARTAIMSDSGIGSVYSPPKEIVASTAPRKHVETVIDIGYRKEGWLLKCEKGGIRRVLMNIFGNSLKFTTNGFVHVLLRQVPSSEDDPPNRVKVELAVLDTGKGISQNFLKNQLFHPFSQENPLQTGTGLGLAIVNSIVQSESVSGKVDVWSEEGSGTEIRTTFFAEQLEEANASATEMEPFKFDDLPSRPTVSLVGFDLAPHAGVELLSSVLTTYLETWWGFEMKSGPECGQIVILNNDPSLVVSATEQHDTSRPFIILSAARGSPTIMSIASEYERIGGFCRIIYKPGGPSRLRAVLKLCLHTLKIGSQSRGPSPMERQRSESSASGTEKSAVVAVSPIPRRNSEERKWSHTHPARPAMIPRSSTAHPSVPSWKLLPTSHETVESPEIDTVIPTINVGSGGTLLKSSVGAIDVRPRQYRVLVVEDNSILRNLLIKWLSTKGYDFRDAVDGRDGVTIYERDGPFDVVLLDLSMPVLDGIAATAEIRHIEAVRAQMFHETYTARILALTGMSSLEDKRRAFDAGVDGYLVKPVAFKTLDEMFHKLGIS